VKTNAPEDSLGPPRRGDSGGTPPPQPPPSRFSLPSHRRSSMSMVRQRAKMAMAGFFLSLCVCVCLCVCCFLLPPSSLPPDVCPSPEHPSTVDVVPMQLDLATRAHINLPQSTILKSRGVTCLALAPCTARSGVPSMLGGFRDGLPVVATQARRQHLVVHDLSCSVRRSLSSLDLAHLGPSLPPPAKPLSGARPWSPSSTLAVRSHTYHPLSLYVVLFFVL
jgi:hypothetical protein